MLSAIWWSYGDNVVNLQVWAKVNLFAIVYLHKYESMTICPPWRTLVGDFSERQNVGDVASEDPHHQYLHKNCLINLKDRVCAKSMQKRKQVTRTLISSNNLEQQSLLEEIQRHQPHIKITATAQKHRRQKGQKVRKRKARRVRMFKPPLLQAELVSLSWQKRGKNYIFGKSMKKYKLFLVTGREINWSIFTQSRILQLLCNNLACFYSFQINMLAS